MNTDAIEQALTPLFRLPLRSIGRCANLLWLLFGETREVATRRGGTKSVGDWAIHVQCAWRLCRHGRIVVAYRDYYYSPDGDALEDWDKPGKSNFDTVASALSSQWTTSPVMVESFTTDDVGGFSLALSGDYRLDVFPDESSKNDDSEHWRLFASASDREHFVVPCTRR